MAEKIVLILEILSAPVLYRTEATLAVVTGGRAAGAEARAAGAEARAAGAEARAAGAEARAAGGGARVLVVMHPWNSERH